MPFVARPSCPSRQKSAPGPSTAFSLVEVTLAIGIISFGLLAVMAIMPVGLSTIRSAMDQTVETQIVRQIGGEIFLTPFSQIPQRYHNKRFYYDEEGKLEVDAQGAASGQPSARSRYIVSTSVTNAPYPGSSQVSLPNPLPNHLTTVRFEVLTPAQAVQAQTTNVYHLRIPNSGE